MLGTIILSVKKSAFAEKRLSSVNKWRSRNLKSDYPLLLYLKITDLPEKVPAQECLV
jgi:hypothetical protein